MESYALLDGSLPPNVHRIENVGIFGVEYSQVYPEMLRGIMQEGEYIDYLKRINEAACLYKRMYLVVILMFFIIFIPVVNIIVGVYMAFVFHRKEKEAAIRVATIIEEINQRYTSRGVRWIYIQATENVPRHIDVVLFNPNSGWNPSIYLNPYLSANANYSSFSSSPSYIPTSIPSSSSSGGHMSPYPTAPPPEMGSSSFIFNNDDVPPPPPSYPGDPTMFTVVN